MERCLCNIHIYVLCCFLLLNVFAKVVQCLEGVVPSKQSVQKKGEESDGDGVEEERRLFFVAASRAKQYLYLSYPKVHKTKLKLYSNFLFFVESAWRRCEAISFSGRDDCGIDKKRQNELFKGKTFSFLFFIFEFKFF
jgi:hypothetical protein